MRQFFVLAVFALVFMSCSGNRQAVNSDSTFELDNLIAVAEQQVDKTITVAGYVTHVCKHSGMKCFIIGESQSVSLLVFAQGEIESFTPELVGSKLSITGILKEERLSQEDIDEMENDVKELQEKEGMEERCAAELDNISEWRKWMKDNNKDYYATYYMDGLKYEVLD
jgi:RecJ-like exonuclease